MRPETLLKLNYPEQAVENNYYTAKLDKDVGVTVAYMVSTIFVQFFPWHTEGILEHATGHDRYANFITSKATSAQAAKAELFTRWPYMELKSGNEPDLLMVKCMIEDGHKQIGGLHDAENNRSVSADAAAGKAVE